MFGYTDIETVFVSLETIEEVSDELEREMVLKQGRQDLVVFQLCDGTGKKSQTLAIDEVIGPGQEKKQVE